jgi:hypothetical protein
MNKQAALFTLLLITACHCLSQKTGPDDPKLSIKTSPLALIDIYGGYSWRIGTEFKAQQNKAVSLEYGRYFTYGDNPNVNQKLDTKGYIIRAELKKYLNKEKLCSGRFISLEYLYKNITFNYLDSIKEGSNPTFQKEYTIFKNISAFTVKYGSLTIPVNRFVWEWYVGAGVRICTGHNTLTPGEEKGLLTGEGHGDLISAGQREINYVLPNISAGFKLGYVLR